MTKIRIISDIHLEFFKNNDFELEVSDDEKNTILILAGDICIAAKAKRFDYFFDNISNRFKTILYILGNHEYYNSSILMTRVKLEDSIDKYRNIIVLEDETYETDEVCFIGSTLWSDFDDNNPIAMFDAKHKMNDSRIIRHGPSVEPWRRKFSPEDAYVIHKTSKKFIFDTIKNSNKKIVVITHMGPSYQSIASEYIGDKLNGAYVSNLENDIIGSGPDLMIHGHVHRSFDYMIGDTRVICNPHGYIGQEYNPNFKPTLEVEL